MSRLLVLVPTILWFLWLDMAEPARENARSAVEPERLLLFLGGMLLAVVVAAYAAFRSARRDSMRRMGPSRTSTVLTALHRLALPAAMTWFGVGLFFLGWGDAVAALVEPARPDVPPLRLPGLLLATLPAYASWALLLAAEYPAVRQRRESRLLVDIDQGRPIYPPPPVLRYWTLALRQRLLFALVPLLVLMLVRDLAMLGAWAAGVTITGTLELWLFVASALVVISLSPEMVRRLLPTRPLPRGALRDRLEALCRSTGMPMRDVLIWDTDGGMVNAAVVGFLPGLRYVLLSDLLLDSMTPAQIEAVFAHEVGHVKHRHLLWYFVFLTGMTLFFAGPVEAAWRVMAGGLPQWLIDGSGLEYAIGLGSLAVILGLFGLLSRCFERQADVYAARVMQAQAAIPMPAGAVPPTALSVPGPVGPAGAEVFGSSLRQAARLNHLPIDRRPSRGGWLAPVHWLSEQFTHFLHGTIRSRIEYLEGLARRPTQTYAFDLSIATVKLAVLAITVGSGTFLLWQ